MSAPQAHCHGFDWLRAAGIAGVVWIHGCDTHPLLLRWSSFAAFAVPAFVLMSAFLFQRSALRQPTPTHAQLIRSRLVRLLPAYLAWSLLYLAVRWLKHTWTGHGGTPLDPLAALLFGGASYQLYFVAALVWWTPLLALLARFCARCPGARRKGLALALVLAGGLALAAGAFWTDHLSFPPEFFLFRQMAILSGYLPIGLAAGLMWSGVSVGGHSSPLWALARVCLLGAVAWLFLPRLCGVAIGPALLLLAWALLRNNQPAPTLARRISGWSFGIFLAHGFFIEGLQMVFGLARISLASVLATLFVITASFVLSCVVCRIFSRHRSTQFLVA